MSKLLLNFVVSEDGFLGALGGLLAGKLFGGSAIAKGIGGAIGSMVGSKYAAKTGAKIDRRSAIGQKRDEFQMYLDAGLTPTEIIGGGGVSGGGNTGQIVGNAYAQAEAQARDYAFRAEQAALDREVQMRAQDYGLAGAQTSAGAQLGAARIQAETAANELALRQRRFDTIEVPTEWRNRVTQSPEWKRWERLSMMSGDNMVVTGLADRYGVTANAAGFAQMTQMEWENFVREVYSYQSRVFRETAGVGQIIQDGGEAIYRGVGNAFNSLYGGMSSMGNPRNREVGNGWKQ
jgi:hypothetical protein